MDGLASTLAVLLGKEQEGTGGELEGVSGELVEQLLPLLASQDPQSLSQREQAVAALQGLPSSLPSLCFCLTHWSLVVVGEELQGQLLSMAPQTECPGPWRGGGRTGRPRPWPPCP